jgi:2-methylisoborneol synthase
VQKSSARVLQVQAEPPGAALAARPPGTATAPRPELYCPPPVRDEPALAQAVNDQLIEWIGQVGIYPGRLSELREANFGRLVMLTYPDTDEPDRLLAAAKIAMAGWAVDDYYCDNPTLGAAPAMTGARLAVAQAVTASAQPPGRYARDLELALHADPVLVAHRSAFAHLSCYAGPVQVQRMLHEFALLYLSGAQEASWRLTGRLPPVWEYLVNRQDSSFRPLMMLIDVIGGYEVPADECAEPRLRRALATAGLASGLVNDLYSMTRERSVPGLDFDLPTAIVTEERCSLEQAVERSARLHDELVHTFEDEAAALAANGSPALRRFLAGVWAWLGGNREWHATSSRYNSVSQPTDSPAPTHT